MDPDEPKEAPLHGLKQEYRRTNSANGGKQCAWLKDEDDMTIVYIKTEREESDRRRAFDQVEREGMDSERAFEMLQDDQDIDSVEAPDKVKKERDESDELEFSVFREDQDSDCEQVFDQGEDSSLVLVFGHSKEDKQEPGCVEVLQWAQMKHKEKHQTQDGVNCETGDHTNPAQKTRREKLMLLKDEEEDVAAWFRANTLFYNKRHRDYKNNQKKEGMLQEKAAELTTPCSGKQLKTWLDSMRTSYGKLMRGGPDGSPKENPTEKEAWVMKNFACCHEWINRAPGRQAPKLKAKIQEKKIRSASEKASEKDAEEDRWSSSAVDADSGEEEGQYDVASRSSWRTSRGKKRPPEDHQQQHWRGPPKNGMVPSASSCEAAHSRMASQQPEPSDHVTLAKRNWADLLFAETLQMDRDTWEDFDIEMMELLTKYKRKMREKRLLQQQKR